VLPHRVRLREIRSNLRGRSSDSDPVAIKSNYSRNASCLTFGPISPLRFKRFKDLNLMPLSSGPSSAHPNILWRASATDDIPLLRERTDAAVARECPWKAGGVKLMELVMASRGRDGPTRTGAEVERRLRDSDRTGGPDSVRDGKSRGVRAVSRGMV